MSDIKQTTETVGFGDIVAKLAKKIDVESAAALLQSWTEKMTTQARNQERAKMKLAPLPIPEREWGDVPPARQQYYRLLVVAIAEAMKVPEIIS